jgi:hypothetical protein
MKENNFKVGDKIQYTSTKGERKTITGTIYKIFSTVFGSCQQGTGLQVDWDNPTKNRRRTTVNAKYCVKVGQNSLRKAGQDLIKSVKNIRESNNKIGKAVEKLKQGTVNATINTFQLESETAKKNREGLKELLEKDNRNIWEKSLGWKKTGEVDIEEKEESFEWTVKPDKLVNPKIIIEPITITFSPNLSEDRPVIAETKALCLFFDDRAKKEGKMKEIPHSPKDVYKKLITYYKEHSVGYGKVRTDYFPRRNIAKEDTDNEVQV